MYEYSARVVRVVDGDTVDLDIDQGFDNHRFIRVRLAGINAPEMNAKDPNERAKAKAAKEFLQNKLEFGLPPYSSIVVRTYKDRTEKYGRYLAALFVLGETVSLNQQLIDAGLASVYMADGLANSTWKER